MTRVFKKAALVFHTLRHSRPRQVIWRPLGLAKRFLLPAYVAAPPTALRRALVPRLPFLFHDPWNSSAQIAEGVFCFLNRVERLGRPVDWAAAQTPLLWQFHLQAFAYLHLLASEQQAALCADWAQDNPVGKGVAWHPYPTSLRIVNWCKAINFHDEELLRSLYRQAAYLYRNLEWHHPGNHLLENARALIFAGRFFAGQGEAEKWLKRGLAIFRRETPAQILGDGGYFERSPMYHALMLEAYLDILNILPAEGAEGSWGESFRDLIGRDLIGRDLTEAAQRMSDFLLSVRHPDGNLALFNDSTQELAPPVDALLTYARQLLDYRAQKRRTFAESGYYIHESDSLYLIIDGGPIAPDSLPSHAHADIFSYELSVGGETLVVDAGVFEYAAGEMRRYVRSTGAHNTVTVDGADQAELWGSFRAARRYPPELVEFRKEGYGSRFQGTFGGYAKLLGDGIVHRRTIRCDDERREILVEDEVAGRRRHLVESRLHLHPDVEVELVGSRATLRRAGARCEIEAADGQGFTVEETWYCPRFGVRRANRALVLGGEVELPARLGYRITY